MATLHINKSKVKNSESLYRLSSLFHVNFLLLLLLLKPEDVRFHFVTSKLQSILIKERLTLIRLVVNGFKVTSQGGRSRGDNIS